MSSRPNLTPPLVGAFSYPTVRLCISTEWASVIDGLLARMTSEDFWDGTPVHVQNAIDNAGEILVRLAQIAECEDRLHLIGEVFMWAGENPPPGALYCNGGTYLAEDWPLLYAVLADSLTDLNGVTFRVPDLTNGRVPAGVGQWENSLHDFSMGFDVGDEAGEFDHTLSVAQMPEHDHNRNTAGVGEYFVRTGGSGTYGIAPGSAPLYQNQTKTGKSGSTQPHNLVQPMTGVKFYIQAQ